MLSPAEPLQPLSDEWPKLVPSASILYPADALLRYMEDLCHLQVPRSPPMAYTMNANSAPDPTVPPDRLPQADKPRRRRWRRRLAIAFLLLAAFVLALVFAGPSLLRPLLRQR